MTQEEYLQLVNEVNSNKKFTLINYPLQGKKEINALKKNSDPFNGHEYVDLGLPSGTLWATVNIGAEEETDTGDFFVWGETESRSGYEEDNYYVDDDIKYTIYDEEEDDYFLTKYCTNSDYGYKGFADNKQVLELKDDAANANWRGNWHIPTDELFNELINNTNAVFENGGVTLTSKTNGNLIFIPNANIRNTNLYAMTSNVSKKTPGGWYYNSAYSYFDMLLDIGSRNRRLMLPIRPVVDKIN